MLSRIRGSITYANVGVTVALIFALTGSAYAANKYLITSTKQIKPSVLKALTGKAGPAGGAGPAGAQGPAGPAGAQGPAGPAGAQGAKGENGSGKEGPQGPAGPAGARGATGEKGEFAGKGATGAPGVTGATGSAGDTGVTGAAGNGSGPLKSGETTTGLWSAYLEGLTTSGREAVFSISFPRSLGTISTKSYYCNEEQTEEKTGECENGETGATETGTGCTGAIEEPTAPAGVLCVYTRLEGSGKEEAKFHRLQGFLNGGNLTPDALQGALIIFTVGAHPNKIYYYGTWAVTQN
jgi:hypothetical protein